MGEELKMALLQFHGDLEAGCGLKLDHTSLFGSLDCGGGTKNNTPSTSWGFEL